MEQPHLYRIELNSKDPRWELCHVVLTAEALDAAGEPCGLTTADNFGATGSKKGVITLCSEPCSSLEAYVYIIPHTLPESSSTEDTPPIEAHLALYDRDELLKNEPLAVNPWGGHTRRLRLPKEEQ